MFLHEAKQLLKTYLLLRPCSPDNSKKGLSRTFSENFEQVLSSMHSNVQLLYLLLFFAVLLAEIPYYFEWKLGFVRPKKANLSGLRRLTLNTTPIQLSIASTIKAQFLFTARFEGLFLLSMWP